MLFLRHHEEGSGFAMAIGERIRFFRNLRGMTQKHLGQLLGFPEKSADVRMAQYETGVRTPKADVVNTLAGVLDVSPRALDVPDIDSLAGIAHTLFALEDTYGLSVAKEDGTVCLEPNIFKSPNAPTLQRFMKAWYDMEAKRKTGEISQEEYDQWRYHYPEFDTSGQWVKVPSQALSDFLVEALTEEEEKKNK